MGTKIQVYYQLNMNIETNSYQNSSSMCKGCKLFFGAEAFQGLCSTCYKKQQGSTKENPDKVKTQKIEPKPEVALKQQQKGEKPPAQQNRNKCHNCSRKLKNLGIQCKCGFVFCTLHRLPEDHECSFDHMGNDKKKLEKALIKVSNGKINMIE